MSDYDRIGRAIEFTASNAVRQPDLSEVAAAVSLSPFHFQRLFCRWAGVTPKRYLQVLTVERAKRLLRLGRQSLLETSETLGLSSSSRLHDHFVQLEAMTPSEFRRSAQDVRISYGEADSRFGRVFLAATERGLCCVSFCDYDAPEAAVGRLRQRWPGASFEADGTRARQLAAQLFERPPKDPGPISVAVQGTNFQIAVWRALLDIPPATLASYGDIARAIGKPRAVRAVGAAIGANPCGFVIPCHRVIRECGDIGGYRWGLTRKQAINVWEAAVADGMLDA